MNEFDDLFDKDEPVVIEERRDSVQDFHDYARKLQKNGILLIVYLIISLVFSFGYQYAYGQMYPNAETIEDNLEATDVTVIVTDNDDLEYPYLYQITGSIQNKNSETLPIIYYQIEFFDADDNSLGSFYYQADDVGSFEYLTMDEEVESTFNYDDYTVTYGFDVDPSFTTLFNLLPVMLTAIAFLFIDIESFKYDFKQIKGNVGKFFAHVFSGFIMVYAALLVSNLILQLLNVTGTSQNEMTIQSMFTNEPHQLIMLFLLLCIFTPIVEEVVFRKIIFNFVEPRLGYKAAIASTGIIFGLMHVLAYGDFIQSIPYIFMGLVFGYIYWRSNKNIWVTIGVHFLNNLLSYSVYFLLIVFGISLI